MDLISELTSLLMDVWTHAMECAITGTGQTNTKCVLISSSISLARNNGQLRREREAAKVFNISRATAANGLKGDDLQDCSHHAHTLHTTRSSTHEAVVVSLRQSLYLPLDDLLYITSQYINPDVSRSRIAHLRTFGRCRSNIKFLANTHRSQ
jgi:hypothetical protein